MNENQRFASVGDAIENTPQQAASMRARSELMMNLTEVIRERGTAQGDAAALFGVTQPRVSDLMRGKINLFSLDTLIDMAATAGISPPRGASTDELLALIDEAYIAVGILADECGRFDDPHITKVMDNLAAVHMVHADVLPFPSKQHNPTECNVENIPTQSPVAASAI